MTIDIQYFKVREKLENYKNNKVKQKKLMAEIRGKVKGERKKNEVSSSCFLQKHCYTVKYFLGVRRIMSSSIYKRFLQLHCHSEGLQ